MALITIEISGLKEIWEIKDSDGDLFMRQLRLFSNRGIEDIKLLSSEPSTEKG